MRLPGSLAATATLFAVRSARNAERVAGAPRSDALATLRLVRDLRPRRHRMHQPHVAADDRIGADGGVAAEDRGAGIDGHVVLDGRVALAVAAARDTERAQGYALIDLDVAADHRGLADDHPGAVVDEEALAALRAGVDV